MDPGSQRDVKDDARVPRGLRRRLLSLSRRSGVGARIRFHIPALPDIDAYLADVRNIVDSGWLSDGRFVRQLEHRVSKWTGGHESSRRRTLRMDSSRPSH
jgi:hypothetical protein